MTESANEPREPAPAEDTVPFGEFEVETEALPDGRKIQYYRWPAAEPPREPDQADV